MSITRDQASRVLTQPEMGLFGDSRNPALRALSEKALASRVERARKLRDKSRDLLQRQKLKSRERTGSKFGASGVANQRSGNKGEILDDILQRFESRLGEVQAAGGSAVSTTGKSKAGVTERNSAASKGTAHKAATKPAARTRTAIASPRTTANASVPAIAGKTAKAAMTQPRKPARRDQSSAAHDERGRASSGVKAQTTRARTKKMITPERALENTRNLLEAKRHRDRETPAYLAIGTQSVTEHPSSGFQSETAKSKALELHEGESRMQAIHGSISTHDRKNQGKRDNR